MPSVIEKIADVLHIPHHHHQEAHKGEAQPATSAETAKPTPVFESEKVTVIFVLGGPGAGEYTPYSALCRDSNNPPR